MIQPTLPLLPAAPYPPHRPRLPYETFVVTALPRSGSYMLTTALDEHPEVRCHGEALSPWREDLPADVASATELLCSEIYTDDVRERAVGFKLQHQDGRSETLRDARAFLRRLGVRVLHLRRRNLLRQVLSFAVAEQTDVWILEAGAERPPPVAVELDPEELLDRFETLEVYRRSNERDFRGCPALAVTYEDLVSDPGEMPRIFRFLGVEPRPVRPATRRQERRPLRQAIANYDTVARALAGTPWRNFLRDEDPPLAF